MLYIKETKDMKKILIFNMLLLYISCASASKQECYKKYLDRHKLKGKVEEQIIYYYDVYHSENRLQMIIESRSVYKYDKHGDILRISCYNSNNILKSKRKFKYDTNRNRIEEFEYSPDDKLIKANINKLDNDGKQVEWLVYDSNKRLIDRARFNIKYKYKGICIDQVAIYSNENGIYLVKTENDYNNNSLEMIRYTTNLELIDRIKYIYNDEGKDVEHIIYDSLGNKIFNRKYYYNNKGNNFETYFYDKNNKLEYKWENKFDDKGNIIEEKEYTYNNGKQREELSNLIRYKYKYREK